MQTLQRLAPARPAEARRSFVSLLSCIRLNEVLVLQGTPLLGALFSIGTLTFAKSLTLLGFALASFCLVAHVFVLNDLGGASADLRDPNRAEGVFRARGISSRAAGILCITLLLLSLLMLVPFGWTPLLLAFALAVLSALYSAPWFAMKGVPLASSVLHFLGGLLQFVLGYSLFHVMDRRSFAIGSFFALTFMAGHLTHEARDSGSDLLNGIQTNAVKFGPAKSFAAGFLLFTAADLLLIALAAIGLVPRALLSVAVLYPLHLRWTLQTRDAGLTFETIRRLQMRYRILYAVLGLVVVLAVAHDR